MSRTINVRILGEEYEFEAPDAASEEKILNAVNYMNSKIQKISHGMQTKSKLKIAVTLALNLSYELMEERSMVYRFQNKVNALDVVLEDEKKK